MSVDLPVSCPAVQSRSMPANLAEATAAKTLLLSRGFTSLRLSTSLRRVGDGTTIRRINAAARKRASADEAKRVATDQLRRYCREAQREGIPITRIASEADLSRQGVYDLLRAESTSS